MLTKIFAAVLMTGALAVAGDAALERVGCCFPGSDCCPSECCYTAAPAKTTATPPKAESSCCSSTTSCCTKEAATPCCEGGLVYCLQTGQVYEGSCCEVVNGQYRCLITGTVSDECCCIPID